MKVSGLKNSNLFNMKKSNNIHNPILRYILKYTSLLTTSSFLLLFSLATSSCTKEVETVSLGQESVQEDVGVTVESYELAYLQVDSDKGTSFTKEPVFLLRIKIKNGGQEQITYQPRHQLTGGNSSQIPLLFVDSGTPEDLPNISGIQLEMGTQIFGQTTDQKVLSNGDEIQDFYIFSLPPEGASKLVFTFPGDMVGRKQLYRFGIDYQQTEPTRPTIYPMKTPAPIGIITVEITNAELKWVSSKDSKAGQGYLDKPLFVVEYSIKNNGPDKLQYSPQHANLTNPNAPTLKNANGTALYPRAIIPVTSEVYTQRKLQVDLLKPPITDQVFFIPPPSDVKELIFSFSAMSIGIPGMAQFKIPYSWKEVPKPWDLTSTKKPDPPKPDPESTAPKTETTPKTEEAPKIENTSKTEETPKKTDTPITQPK